MPTDKASQPKPPLTADVIALHQQACERGEAFYIDPVSGLQVKTRLAHLKRGRCCESGCRHCPYGFVPPLPK